MPPLDRKRGYWQSGKGSPNHVPPREPATYGAFYREYCGREDCVRPQLESVCPKRWHRYSLTDSHLESVVRTNFVMYTPSNGKQPPRTRPVARLRPRSRTIMYAKPSRLLVYCSRVGTAVDLR